MISFGFSYRVVVKFFDVLEEHTASFVRVTDLMWLDSEVIKKKKISVDYIGRFDQSEGGELSRVIGSEDFQENFILEIFINK